MRAAVTGVRSSLITNSFSPRNLSGVHKSSVALLFDDFWEIILPRLVLLFQVHDRADAFTLVQFAGRLSDGNFQFL